MFRKKEGIKEVKRTVTFHILAEGDNMIHMKNSHLFTFGLVLLVVIGVIGFSTNSAAASSENTSIASSNWIYEYPIQMQWSRWYSSGGGCPMWSGWWYPASGVQRLNIDEVKSRLSLYISSIGQGFFIKEIMEFTNNFYAIVIEEDTGMGAFEVLVNPYTGQIMPEPGPNMMWNIKYGMHSRMWYMMSPRAIINPATLVTEDEAMQIAFEYLSRIYSGSIEVEEPTKFYGYYTMDYKLDGRIHGMLSVNQFTGAVWYHSWHGDFIQEIELIK
ncbi:MAG: hypothetical protein NZ929_04435 [Aigarchaeota archaeon]|nr:hypothetical protein [Aigarchaeota archaeon]MCX8192734.1 hypothetical protein [Nitrososphaeria archaeon]MDW7985986.1 hypothetical protein [Nitrososphaerota archaeon]